MASRILISGGAGFIGSHVVETLTNSNNHVCVIDNLSTGKPENLASQLHNRFFATSLEVIEVWDLEQYNKFNKIGWVFPKLDILDLKGIDGIFKAFLPDAIIHLAAQPSIQASWKAADRDAKVNILGTINLLGLCQKYNVKRFVFASTSAVYSPEIGGVYSEGYPTNPRTPYGVSKLAAEQYIKISGISYAILRLGNVYGPRQVPLGENQLIPRYLAHIFQGKNFVINGDGRQRRDFIYVTDVANAFLKAVESEETGVFNISSGSSFIVIRILRRIDDQLKELGHRYTLQSLVSRRKHGPAKKGELRSVTLDNVLAKHVFNWKPEVSIMEGLGETVAAWPK